MHRTYTFIFMAVLGSHGVSCELQPTFNRRTAMDLMHKIVPEEEVYQMLMLFVLGVLVGAIAGLMQHFKVERSKA